MKIAPQRLRQIILEEVNRRLLSEKKTILDPSEYGAMMETAPGEMDIHVYKINKDNDTDQIEVIGTITLSKTEEPCIPRTYQVDSIAVKEAYHGKGIRIHYEENAIKDSIEQAMKIMDRKIDTPIKYCAFREGIPKKPLWEFLQTKGFDAVFTQTPTNRRAAMDGIGRIQVDDDDHNIFLTKISKTYLFFKDKPSWKYIRKHGVDKLAHRISETLNRVRRDNG